MNNLYQSEVTFFSDFSRDFRGICKKNLYNVGEIMMICMLFKKIILLITEQSAILAINLL